jgi:nucleoside-diphosphate-sugar epimerase
MRTLVLGGTRFLGPFLVNELLRRRHEVAVLSRAASGADLTALVGERYDAPVRVYAGDASDPACLQETMRSWQPDLLVDMLHHGPAQAAVVAQAGVGLQHSVHLSCASVYGPRPVCPVDEETETIKPELAPPEVAAQLAADGVIMQAIAAERLPATIVRLPELYGPRDPRSAEWFFARRLREGRTRIALPDGGLAICHRGFVQNMAWGIAQALTTSRAIGQVYNLGEEKLYTLAQLARGAARALDTKWDLYSLPGHLWATPYQHTSFFDLRKARAQLRYRDRMIPRDGLEITLAWLNQQPRGGDWKWPGIADPFDYPREDALIDRYGVKLEV